MAEDMTIESGSGVRNMDCVVFLCVATLAVPVSVEICMLVPEARANHATTFLARDDGQHLLMWSGPLLPSYHCNSCVRISPSTPTHSLMKESN